MDEQYWPGPEEFPHDDDPGQYWPDGHIVFAWTDNAGKVTLKEISDEQYEAIRAAMTGVVGHLKSSWDGYRKAVKPLMGYHTTFVGRDETSDYSLRPLKGFPKKPTNTGPKRDPFDKKGRG